MIILFGGEKGGAGKTTLAINIAVARAARQSNLLLVDTDRQCSASYWCHTRRQEKILPQIDNIRKFEDSLKEEINDLKEKYTDIIIDAGGRDSAELRGALLVCDKVIFPIRPSQLDMWTLGRLAGLLDTVKEINPKLEAYVVINAALTHVKFKQTELDKIKNFIPQFKHLQNMKTVVYDRVVYLRSILKGQGVMEYKPQDIKAIKEIEELYKEIYEA